MFKDPTVWRFINSYYEKSREKCNSLEELWKIVAKKIFPLILYNAFNDIFDNIKEMWNEDGSVMNIKQIKKKLKDAKELRDFKENLKKLVKEIGLN